MTEKKSKLGPAFKWGEETVPVTVKNPKIGITMEYQNLNGIRS